MKRPLLFLFILISNYALAQPANDNCSGARLIVPATTCVAGGSSLTGQTISAATGSGVATTCGLAASPDVWYKFRAMTSNPTITVSGAGTSWGTAGANMRLQLLSRTGPCAGLAQVGAFCASGLTLSPTGLTIGDTFYVRVLKNDAAAATGTNWGFTICIQITAPANDACANAVNLNTVGSTCTATQGNLYLAAQTNPTASCGNMYDVYYRFTLPATASYAAITVTPKTSPSSLTSANTFIEVFNTNACASLANNATGGCNNIAETRYIGPLTGGNTYYFRVYTTANPNGAVNPYNFDVCVTGGNYSVGSAGRMNEVFKQTLLSVPNVLEDPWDVVYGYDGNLWLTEAKGYKIYKMNPNDGTKTTVLNIAQGSTFFSSPAQQAFNLQFDFATQGNPQGGCAGLVMHPDWNSGQRYVYVSYIHKYISTAAGNAGVFFRNNIVRFFYNTGTGLLESPVTLCDTLPGSSDHNSQRMIIAPVNGTNYLFYAAGDMGAGQFGNQYRVNHAQDTAYYEGKILRFNLIPDNDDGGDTTKRSFIPNDNPFNNAPVGINPPTRQSAVWATGIRNNQGFAYAKGFLYGSSHGPFTDDEVNIIIRAKNYGHPRVIGYKADGNYNGARAGNAPCSLPLIYDELKYANDTIAADGYRDPIYSFYPAPKGANGVANTVQDIYINNPGNAGWPSIGASGMDIYTNSMIPGWKNSLIMGALKGGKVVRMKLNATGDSIQAPGAGLFKKDTTDYFRSKNRFRDIALGTDGKTVYTCIDKSQTTSGPTSGTPMLSACPGCVLKYQFLGYKATGALNKSTIDTSVTIAPGVPNDFHVANKVVINAANDNTNLWVPITDSNSNIVAEINARGQNLDTVKTFLYTRTGPSRIKSSKKYMNRQLTISPKVQPASPVWIRLYISKAELDTFVAHGGLTGGIANLKIIKNEDSCQNQINTSTVLVNTTVAEEFGKYNGYVLQGDISGFSTFFFSPDLITLPVNLLTFKGSLQGDDGFLQWQTAQETNTAHFVIERSLDGTNFSSVGTVTASGNSTSTIDYSYLDNDITSLPVTLVYYRLRMVDIDGQFSYSKVVTIQLPFVAGRVSVLPNPVINKAKVTIFAAAGGRVQWRLVDNSGRIIMNGTEQVSQGNNQFDVNMSKLTAGMYYLTLTGAGIDQNIKLQKQ
jgi:glucose/arabinose dehydrogenase